MKFEEILKKEIDLIVDSLDFPLELLSYVYDVSEAKELLVFLILDRKSKPMVEVDLDGRLLIIIEDIPTQSKARFTDLSFEFSEIIKSCRHFIHELIDVGIANATSRINSEIDSINNHSAILPLRVYDSVVRNDIEQASKELKISKRDILKYMSNYHRDFNHRKLLLFDYFMENLYYMLDDTSGKEKEIVSAIYHSILKADMNYLKQMFEKNKLIFKMNMN